MRTQCPECKKQRSISVKELRSSRGMIRCDECSSMFDALELLNEGNASNEINTHEALPALKSSSATDKGLWGAGYSFCIILFIYQVYFFESYNLTQNTQLRPWLNTVCHYINCLLPAYKNLNEFTILHGAFEATEKDTYLFNTAFSNQSAFEQSYPSIKLSLQNFNGQTFAERIFHPQDYAKNHVEFIAPDKLTEITMKIAAPSEKIGGYHFLGC